MKSRRLVCPFVVLLIFFASTTPADADRARAAGKAATALTKYVSKKVDIKYYTFVALLAGVFKFLIGPATVLGSIVCAKDSKNDGYVKLIGLIVAIIGGMACAYLWLGAGFSFLGLLSYFSFGWIGAGMFVWFVFFPDAAGESSVDSGKVPDRRVSHAVTAKPAEKIEETNRLKEMAGREGAPGKKTTSQKKTPVKKVSAKNKTTVKKKSGAKKKLNAKKKSAGKKKTPVKKASAKNKATVKKKSVAKKKLNAKKKSAGKKKTPVKKASAKNKATVKKKSVAKKKLSAKKKSAGKKKTPVKKASAKNKATVKKKLSAKKKSAGKK